MKSLFEQLGGTYTRQGDYCLPNVCLPPEEERAIGIYGQRRRTFLREHHRVLYYNLLTTGSLAFNLSVTPSESAYCSTNRRKSSCACSSMSARYPSSVPAVSRL